jgi:hypothetical protein
MNITKEQLDKYIEIQKRERGIQLTEKEATKEAQSLLLFIETILKVSYRQEKQSQTDIEDRES